MALGPRLVVLSLAAVAVAVLVVWLLKRFVVKQMELLPAAAVSAAVAALVFVVAVNMTVNGVVDRVTSRLSSAKGMMDDDY